MKQEWWAVAIFVLVFGGLVVACMVEYGREYERYERERAKRNAKTRKRRRR